MSAFSFGPFVLDPAERRLTRDGRGVAVPGKAWQILLMLAEAGGHLVSHQTLRAKLWPNVVVEERTLTVHVSTLRKALDDGSPSDFIETVPRAGYRLAVPVRVLSEPIPAPSTANRRPVLAVRSFAAGDLAGDDAYLGIGIADAVSVALGALPGFTVSPVNAVADLTVARALGVGHLLEGMVQLSDERISVSARLIDVASGRTQSSERFEQPQVNGAALQDAIATWVASSLPQPSAVHGLHSYRPRTAEAYFLQLQARAHLKPFTRLPLMKALTLFEQALALDPDYAMAHAGLASTYLLMASTAMLRPLQVDEAIPLARQAAERALALDEGLAEAWAALGRIKMEQARQLDPRQVETLQHMAIVYWMAGESERALAAVDESLAVDPASSRARYGRVMILDQLGRHDEAMAERLATLRRLSVAQGLAEHLEVVARTESWRAAMEVWIALLERTNRWEGAAMQWMAIGEPGRALDALEHCVKARTTYLCFTAQNPYFRGLHNDARFQRLLRTLKLDGRTGAFVSKANA